MDRVDMKKPINLAYSEEDLINALHRLTSSEEAVFRILLNVKTSLNITQIQSEYVMILVDYFLAESTLKRYEQQNFHSYEQQTSFRRRLHTPNKGVFFDLAKITEISNSFNQKRLFRLGEELEGLKNQDLAYNDKIKRWSKILSKHKVRKLSVEKIKKIAESLEKDGFILKKKADSDKILFYYYINQKVRTALERREERKRSLVEKTGSNIFERIQRMYKR